MKSKIPLISFALVLIALALSVTSARADDGHWVVVKGNSMRPVLTPDSWVFVEKIPYNQIKSGMIVVRHGVMGYSGYVVHTAKNYHSGFYFFGKVIGEGWDTQGENAQTNPHLDRGLMNESNYVGVVTDKLSLAQK